MSMSFKRTIIASGLMLLTMLSVAYFKRVEDVPLKKPFAQFPMQIGEWVGAEEHFDDKVYEVLGVDDSILGNYRTADGRRVQLYVGFYQSQREGDLIHSPRNCMPGAGWNIVESAIEELDDPGNAPSKVGVNKLILQKGSEKQMVLYWYQSQGRFVASEYMQKVYLVTDSITRHRTDGSFVRLIAPVRDGDEESALKTIKGFAHSLVPVLHEFIPS
jgi:EpsI family protein